MTSATNAVELLASYPDITPDLIADDLICRLAAHDDGDHYAIVYDHHPGPHTWQLENRATQRSNSGNPSTA